MNFKNLILTTILLLNSPITICAEDISLTDFISNEPKASELADTKHAKYLLDRKIPIYSGLPKHEHLVDKQTIQLVEEIKWKQAANPNLSRIKEALAIGANPNVNVYQYYDCGCYHFKVMNIYYGGLLNKELKGLYQYEYTPALIQVIDMGKWEIAEALILAGADVNLPSIEENTSPATDTGHKKNVMKRRHTPLTVLVSMQESPETLKLVKLLLKHGADINSPDIDIDNFENHEITTHGCYTALQLALKHKNAKIAELLQAQRTETSNTLFTYLAYAYTLGFIALLTWGELGQ